MTILVEFPASTHNNSTTLLSPLPPPSPNLQPPRSRSHFDFRLWFVRSIDPCSFSFFLSIFLTSTTLDLISSRSITFLFKFIYWLLLRSIDLDLGPDIFYRLYALYAVE
ncbi:hypothetical protein DFH28DRAFT_1105545 [Melampsora americana]|nr:hypothetical protein DFH28DRAFT_1105545 [Melampsora americana]